MTKNERNLKAYELLRDMHNLCDEIFEEYSEMNSAECNALDAVNSVLYMAEAIFADQS